MRLPTSLAITVIATVMGSAYAEDSDLSLSINAVESPKSGADVQIRITVTNVSSHDVTIEDMIPQFVYHFDVRDRDGRTVAETQHFRRITGKEVSKSGQRVPVGGSMIIGTLKPGQTFEENLPLHKWFDLKKPGRYTVQVTRSGAKSNVLAFTVRE